MADDSGWSVDVVGELHDARSGTLIIVTPPCQLTVTCVAPDLFALTEATSNVAGA